MSEYRRAAMYGVLVVVSVLAVATGQTLAEGSRAIADCDAARARGDEAEAVAAAKRAAEAVVPGSPHPAQGYERLGEMARDAERRGDEQTAASAWRGMRGAALSTRALGVSNDAWRQTAEDGLVRVAGQVTRAGSPWTAGDTSGEKASSDTGLRAALAVDDTPPTWRFLLVALGSLAFFAAVLRFITGALPGILTRIQIGRQNPQ